MRRRWFLGVVGAGLAGLAGCAGLSDDPTATATETEPTTPTRTARETDPDSPRTGRLRFADEIGQTTRERCRRALPRVREITGEGLTDDVWVRHMDVQSPTTPHPVYRWIQSSVPHAAVLPPADTDIPHLAGRYVHGDRTIYLVHPAQLPESVLDDLEGEPPYTYENYPYDPFLAHELAHAVQYATVQIAPAAGTLDAQTASVGVREGTAAYVQHRYGVACDEGRYDPCQYRESFPGVDALPLWLAIQRFPYINGMAYAYEVIRRGGWERLWERHRDPPATTWALLFPRAFLADGVSVRSVPAPPDSVDAMERQRTFTPGPAALNVLLRALGAVDPNAPAAATSEGLRAETTRQWRFGTELLRGWRGDRMGVYRVSQAYRWDTAWVDGDAAADVVEALRTSFDRLYERVDGAWRTPESFVTVGRDGATVTQTTARTRDAAVSLLDAD